jgi:hypothetical protein
MLPYIDEHEVRIDAPRDVVWRALEQYVVAFLRRAERSFLARLLGTEPRAGFEVAERMPIDRLVLAGRHRFSRYQLAFDLTDAADRTTLLRATTHAEFPGLRGRAYRALVIGTHGHVVVTMQMLRAIRRRAASIAAAVPAALDEGMTSSAPLLTVEDHFLIEGRGLLVVPAGDLPDLGFRTFSTEARIQRPDRTEITTVVRFELQHLRLIGGGSKWNIAVVLPEATKESVPIGSRVVVSPDDRERLRGTLPKGAAGA